MQTRSVTLFCIALILTCACQDRKEAAGEAINKARDALEVLRMDSARYELGVLENLQESLDEMVRRDASGDYSGVVEDARELMKELESAEQLVQQLRKDTNVATAQAVARWNQSSSKTGALLEQLSAGIGQRARAPGTPADLEALATARATLADLRSQWLQAESKFASGEASGAVQLADDIQRRAREVLNDLGFNQASVAGTVPAGG